MKKEIIDTFISECNLVESIVNSSKKNDSKTEEANDSPTYDSSYYLG